ncbi:methyl-accepting chemotaxis protein [Paenibacillus sp. PR3]|uniref:Methyl-accepting chemotaxis protein n=1 Tax=Paenibacillus terricola TaxID=2763503 RepID=A0ABR8MUY1_9BACL|nr:methyl-accepting chemotaxis protein [Paenibacillus terricola]MBD3919778.1 methyl-accepting chemotaxis protein [Paenibacillus terricola]
MRVTVGKKMMAGFALLLVLMVVISALSAMQLKSLKDKVDTINDVSLPGVQSIQHVNYLTEHVLSLSAMYALEDEVPVKEQYRQQITEANKELQGDFRKYSETIVSDEEQGAFNSLTAEWEQFQTANAKVLELSDIHNEQDAGNLLQQTQASYQKMQSTLDFLLDFNNDHADDVTVQSNETYHTSLLWIIGLSIVSLVVGIAAASILVLSISRPLTSVTRAIERVSHGDLTIEPLEVKGRDETADLASAMNAMVVNWSELIASALHSSYSVASAAQQISASTEEVSSTSDAQAQTAQHITELFRELNIAVQTVASSAEDAAEMSAKSAKVARGGGQIVSASIQGISAVTNQMKKLEDDSKQIGDIIEVIDEIAAQTNLIALNAAIEAARAGEQGRGFAVVADEVRKLAERSGEATKRITSIIKGMQGNTAASVESVTLAVTQTKRVGETFEQIIDLVGDTADRVGEIAASSEQQAAQTDEVFRAIESIAAASEETAASTEETASTSQTLAKLAQHLSESVSQFKLKGSVSP